MHSAFLLANYLILARGVPERNRADVKHHDAVAVCDPCRVLCQLADDAGAADGLKFLFSPDFSQVTPSVMIEAMGRAFFSLSLGLGCLITYSSYFRKETPLLRTAGTMAALDTLVAILAGVIIFRRSSLSVFSLRPVRVWCSRSCRLCSAGCPAPCSGPRSSLCCCLWHPCHRQYQ